MKYVIHNIWKRFVIVLTWLLFLIIRTVANKNPVPIKKILVLYVTGIGDVICLTPFFKRVREKFPEAQIWSCFSRMVSELENEFYAFDDNISYKSFGQSLRDIRKQRFDLIILPGWILKDSLIALLSGAEEVIGFINDMTFSGRYINNDLLQSTKDKSLRISQDMSKCHLSERGNSILEYYNLEVIRAGFSRFTRTAAAEYYIVMHAGARFPGRRWLPENFAAIIDYLIDNNYCSTVKLIGDKSDVTVNRIILNRSHSKHVEDFAAKLSLLETRKLIERAKMFIGNDSGPMHIAALSGVPTIGLLGPNFPHISGPLGKNSISVFHQQVCTGCNQRRCNYGYKCINAIKQDEVIKAIGKLVNE